MIHGLGTIKKLRDATFSMFDPRFREYTRLKLYIVAQSLTSPILLLKQALCNFLIIPHLIREAEANRKQTKNKEKELKEIFRSKVKLSQSKL